MGPPNVNGIVLGEHFLQLQGLFVGLFASREELFDPWEHFGVDGGPFSPSKLLTA